MNKSPDEIRGRMAAHSARGRRARTGRSRAGCCSSAKNLKTEQRFRLRDLLRYDLKTVRAYLLESILTALLGYNSPVWAGKVPS